MSLVPRSIKEFGFVHQFTISALYIEKDNNISFAGIYRLQDTVYFCISGSKFGFIYFPLDIIKVSRLIKGEISLVRFIIKSRRDLMFSRLSTMRRYMILILIIYKIALKRYNKIPNAYYFWHAFLNGTNKNLNKVYV